MNTTLTEISQEEIEELRKDYYAEYYPSPRIEKAIFNFLDQDYYAGEDDVFYTVYKKENDFFVNQEEIEKEITKMFGLHLPERIKVGPNEDDYIEPARNPIPGRVLHKWVTKHQLKLRTPDFGKGIAEDLEYWGVDGDEMGPVKEQVNPEDYGIIDGEKKDDGAERLYKQHAHDNEDYVDNSPFTRKETIILKALHKNLTKDELQTVARETPTSYGLGDTKFWQVMKLFGIVHTNDMAEDTRSSIYAKWALDNWTEDGDYGSIEAPIKAPLKWYEIDRSESGSQIEYRDGTAEVLGFDEDDAGDRADYDFYSWGGDMETTDYGDYETYDSQIDRAEFIRLDEQEQKKLLNEIEINVKGVQKALGALGFFFPPADGLNAILSFIQRDWLGGILNLVAIIPGPGDLAKAVFGPLLKLFPATTLFNIISKSDKAVLEVIEKGRNHPEIFRKGVNWLKNGKDEIIGYIDPILDALKDLPDLVKKAMPKDWPPTLINYLTNLKQFFIKLANTEIEDILASATVSTAAGQVGEQYDEEEKLTQDEKEFEIDRLETEIEIDQESIKNMEKELKKVDKPAAGVFGKTKRFGYGDEDGEEEDKPAVIGIKGTTTQLGEQQTPKLDFPEWKPQLKISDKSEKITKDIQKTQIELKKTELENKKKQLQDLKTKVTQNDDDDSPPAMGDSKPSMGGDDTDTGAINISGIEDVNEDLNPELKYAIDQEYRTDPEMRDTILQSLEGEEDGKYYLNPEGAELNVPPIKIAQKFSDVNGYGNIKFDMQGGNGIAYFTDKNKVIKLTTDDSEYFTANKLVGTENDYIVKVFESARIKTSHTKDYDLFAIVLEALPMTEEMEQKWSDCCCGKNSPVYIDYLEEPALVLPPVSEQEKCLPIYDNIVNIQKNFAEYGIVWSDIGIDNMGIKEGGKLAVIDLGETRGGLTKGGEVVLNLENVKIRPLTNKQIQKQLLLI